MGEFELIRRYFDRKAPARTDLHRIGLGIGDDCALLAPRNGFDLAVSTDMLVEGRHFLAGTDAESLGWKTLAVNLSDLAAMGAQPLAFTLALALPVAAEAWLEGFSRGLFACADEYRCALIGGDTTRGPLNLCITVFGEVPHGAAVLRSGARAGDDVWVSGRLGDAALGLRMLNESAKGSSDDAPMRTTAMNSATHSAILALERPTPRVALGLALRGIASSMLDVSDGLLGDLGHLLEASASGTRDRLGARIEVELLPLSEGLRRELEPIRLACALAGGDDYELCFTATAAARGAVAAAGEKAAVAVTRIGSITSTGKIDLVDNRGLAYPFPDDLKLESYDHFGSG